jgi:hypothetical protein
MEQRPGGRTGGDPTQYSRSHARAEHGFQSPDALDRGLRSRG